MPRIPELDYMVSPVRMVELSFVSLRGEQAFVTFEVYERVINDKQEFSLRISLSEGAHAFPLDTNLDAKHALRVQPRRYAPALASDRSDSDT